MGILPSECILYGYFALRMYIIWIFCPQNVYYMDILLSEYEFMERILIFL